MHPSWHHRAVLTLVQYVKAEVEFYRANDIIVLHMASKFRALSERPRNWRFTLLYYMSDLSRCQWWQVMTVARHSKRIYRRIIYIYLISYVCLLRKSNFLFSYGCNSLHTYVYKLLNMICTPLWRNRNYTVKTQFILTNSLPTIYDKFGKWPRRFFIYAQGFRVNAACAAASPANNHT